MPKVKHKGRMRRKYLPHVFQSVDAQAEQREGTPAAVSELQVWARGSEAIPNKTEGNQGWSLTRNISQPCVGYVVIGEGLHALDRSVGYQSQVL